MTMNIEGQIVASAAVEVIKLIDEHVKEGGPFDNELLLSVSAALGECHRIEIIQDSDLTAFVAENENATIEAENGCE
jgi:hypothetical protein